MKKLHPRGDAAKLSLTSGWIVGLDEVGAGCLAGPLCVAAFAYPVSIASTLKLKSRVFDSKMLTAEKREEASVELKSLSECFFKLIWIEVPEIDTLNIFWARMKAFWSLIFIMEESLEQMESDVSPHYLVDGPRLNRRKDLPVGIDELEMMELEKRIFAQSRADSTFFAVAAASILAKVERDQFMANLSVKYTDTSYLWEKNKGYATPDHIEAIKKHGLTEHHRQSFCKNFSV